MWVNLDGFGSIKIMVIVTWYVLSLYFYMEGSIYWPQSSMIVIKIIIFGNSNVGWTLSCMTEVGMLCELGGFVWFIAVVGEELGHHTDVFAFDGYTDNFDAYFVPR